MYNNGKLVETVYLTHQYVKAYLPNGLAGLSSEEQAILFGFLSQYAGPYYKIVVDATREVACPPTAFFLNPNSGASLDGYSGLGYKAEVYYLGP